MKLVLDQGLPRSVAERLRATGTAAVHLGELGMATAADSEVIAFARESGAVVVALIDRILVRCREEIETGAMVSSDGRRIRVRKLPLLR